VILSIRSFTSRKGPRCGRAFRPDPRQPILSALERRAGFPLVRAGQLSAMSRSAEQAAKNESTFRQANERLEEKAAELGFGDESTPCLCECEDERCTRVIELTREEYEAVRASPRRFLMQPGHQEPDDRVVREAAHYIVIEKSGKEGDLVADQDPRSAEGA
jgi:hypothetical protein